MPIDQTTQRLLQTLAPQKAAATPNDPVDVAVATSASSTITQVQAPMAAEPTQPAQLVQPVQPAPPPANQNDELALLDKILAEAEQSAPQAVPTAMFQAVAEATQALTPKTGSGGKETIGATAGVKNVVEAGGSTQYVEYEPNPELPPEVEGYLNKTEQHSDQAPPEIVIADSVTSMPTDRQLPSQPVVVLPITPEVEKIGMSKPPQFSIRWLVEWSHKIMKMFVGKVIYFQKK